VERILEARGERARREIGRRFDLKHLLLAFGQGASDPNGQGGNQNYLRRQSARHGKRRQDDDGLWMVSCEFEHNVMFLCNHNSCRSQMADGLMRTLRGDSSIGVASSGIVGGTKVKPGAITVMSEIGIDISAYTSDDVRDFPRAQFDVVISCCGCGSKLDNDELRDWKEKPLLFEDWALDDPPAIDPGDLSEYRRVRDECREKVLKLIKFLEE